MQVKKQQLEPDMEQWTGSKLEKEPVKAVYCYRAYLTYMQSTSWDVDRKTSISALLTMICSIWLAQFLPDCINKLFF